MGRRKRRSFTPEFKAEIVRVIRTSGKSIEQIAKEYDLTESAVRNWDKQARIDEKGEPNGPPTTEAAARLHQVRPLDDEHQPEKALTRFVFVAPARTWDLAARCRNQGGPGSPVLDISFPRWCWL